jgi:hypothetical protein
MHSIAQHQLPLPKPYGRTQLADTRADNASTADEAAATADGRTGTAAADIGQTANCARRRQPENRPEDATCRS